MKVVAVNVRFNLEFGWPHSKI